MNIQTQIEKKLTAKFNPIFLKVLNESHLHHSSQNSASHFRIEIISKYFDNLSLLSRHRAINETISEELTLIKACSMQVLTEEEWLKKNKNLEKSAFCTNKHE